LPPHSRYPLYNDEVMYCIQPVPYTQYEADTFAGITADIVVVDGTTNRYCT
jgi:hypothetical protein